LLSIIVMISPLGTGKWGGGIQKEEVCEVVEVKGWSNRWVDTWYAWEFLRFP